MNALQMTDAKEKRMDEVEDLALDTIKDALKETIPADAEQVKVAVKTVSMVAKNRQTLSHRQAFGLAAASAIATPEELKRYITVTHPQIKKALLKSK